MNSNGLRCLSMVAISGLLGACTLPPLEIDQASATASLIRIGDWEMTVCIDGERFAADPPKGTDEVRVPAGKRIDVRRDVVFTQHRFDRVVVTTCIAAVSLVPQAGERYFVGVIRQGIACLADVVRSDVDAPTGVAPEPTLDLPTCEVEHHGSPDRPPVRG